MENYIGVFSSKKKFLQTNKSFIDGVSLIYVRGEWKWAKHNKCQLQFTSKTLNIEMPSFKFKILTSSGSRCLT